MESIEDYEFAVAELQGFLDAPQAPPVGSLSALRFEELLDTVESYERSLSGIVAFTEASLKNKR